MEANKSAAAIPSSRQLVPVGRPSSAPPPHGARCKTAARRKRGLLSTLSFPASIDSSTPTVPTVASPPPIEASDFRTTPVLTKWPATSTATATGAGKGNGLIVAMETYLETHLRRIEAQSAPDEPKLLDLFEVYLGAFEIFVGSNSIYGHILQQVLRYGREFIDEYHRVQQEKGGLEERLHSIDKEYISILNDLRDGYSYQVGHYKQKIGEHQAEVKKLLQLTDVITEKNQGIKQELQLAKKKVDEEVRQRQLANEKIQYKRNALRELQERAQNLLDENASLYQVARFNEDLLREVEERKAAAEAMEASFAKERESLVESVRGKERELVEKDDLIRNARRVSRLQRQELEEMKTKLFQVTAELAEATSHVNDLLAHNTPRPRFTTLEQALPALNLSKIPSTRERIQSVSSEVGRMKQLIESQNRKLMGCENIIAFLQIDDNELKMYATKTLPPPGKAIVAQGTHDLVPLYLRYFGIVRNRCFTVHDTRMQIKEFDGWLEKTLRAENGVIDGGIDEAFQQWTLMKSAGQEATAAEYAYSLADALERFKVYEMDLCAFHRCLAGDAPYNLYRALMKQVDIVKVSLEAVDMKIGKGSKSGILKRKLVYDVLHQLYKTRSEAELMKLKNTFNRDWGKRMVDFKLAKDDVAWEVVFVNDDHGFSSEFVRCIQEQFLHDYDELRVEFEQLLFVASQSKKGVLLTSPRLIKACLQTVDPTKPVPDVETYIAAALGWGGRRHLTAREWRSPHPLYPAIRLGRKHGLYRTARRPERRSVKQLAQAKPIQDALAELRAELDNDGSTPPPDNPRTDTPTSEGPQG